MLKWPGFRDITLRSGNMPRKPIGETADDRRRTPGPLAGRPRSRKTDHPHPSPARSSRPGPALARPRRRPRGSTDRICRLAGQPAGQPARQRDSPKHCRRSAISTSPNCRRSSRRAASAGTDPPPPRAACTGGSTGTPRAPLRQPLDGHSASRGSPLWTTGTSRSAGGQFWTPIGGQYSTPIDSWRDGKA